MKVSEVWKQIVSNKQRERAARSLNLITMDALWYFRNNSSFIFQWILLPVASVVPVDSNIELKILFSLTLF